MPTCAEANTEWLQSVVHRTKLKTHTCLGVHVALTIAIESNDASHDTSDDVDGDSEQVGPRGFESELQIGMSADPNPDPCRRQVPG